MFSGVLCAIYGGHDFYRHGKYMVCRACGKRLRVQD